MVEVIGKAAMRRPHGNVTITEQDGQVKEFDTVQCCHCGSHTPFVPGSGRKRGFCTLCNGMTCSNPACYEHFPIEQRMDLYEKGLLPELTSPRELAGMRKVGSLFIPED